MDTDAKFLLIDEAYNYPNPTFKGAGMAIPVSGIKTRECTGIGAPLCPSPVPHLFCWSTELADCAIHRRARYRMCLCAS